MLPFKNLNKDAAQDYLADGVHEALITDLARAAAGTGLRVISHTSAEFYRGRRAPISEIAHDLGVDAVVEGSVLRDGNRLLIYAQLIRAENEDHLWAGRYERQVEDLFGAVTEVSQAIRAEVQQAVAGAGGKGAHPRSARPEVVGRYLRARYAYQSLTPGALEEAVRHFDGALELDPGFAPAWSGLAMARTAQAFIGNAPPGEVLPRARDAAQRALAPMVSHAYADYLMVTGDVAGSLEQMRTLHANDPLAWPARAVFLFHAYTARRYEEVVHDGRSFLAAFPDRTDARRLVATALWLSGRRDEALAEWQKALGPDGGAVYDDLRRAWSRGDSAGVLSRLAEETVAAVRAGRQPAAQTAALYAGAANRERAVFWLEQSFARHEPSLLHTAADPLFDPIRDDAGFQALLRRIGIVQPPR